MTAGGPPRRRSPPDGEAPLRCARCAAGCSGHAGRICPTPDCECQVPLRRGLGPLDKQPATHGHGYDFRHAAPQRRVATVAGDLLLPASADQIPAVPVEHLEACERAVRLLADLLCDRDHQRFLGDADGGPLGREADREAQALRRLSDGMLRQILRTT